MKILSGLKENDTIEEIDMPSSSNEPKLELAGLSGQKGLKRLRIGKCFAFNMDSMHDESILDSYRKNYFLEECDLEPWNPRPRNEAASILRLNKAGWRYLVENRSSRARGVAVLEAVIDDITCLYLHLQENPLLCDTQVTSTVHQGAVRAKRRRIENHEENLEEPSPPFHCTKLYSLK